MRDKSTEGISKPKMTKVASAFLENQSSLKQYISRFIRHSHDIEDIVHETFLRTYAAEIDKQIHSPKAFLYRTAKNLALKHVTKCSYRLTDYLGDLDPTEVITDETSLEESVETQEQFAVFCRAVQYLPLQCRRVFILRKVYGLSYKDIAEQLEISVSTVEKHLASGISRCRDYLRSKGYTYDHFQLSRKRNSR